jgi:serine phosphatase RsbU (regulator of sigma subunit)/anti-sigma regulatory factor (Ser/Thr protein kinase)
MPARFDRLTLKLTVTIVLFAVLTSAAPAVLVGYGFGQAQQTATNESKRGLESQERSALLRLMPSEAQLSVAPLLQAKRAGALAARYLAAMAQLGAGLSWDMARHLRREPTGQYGDPDPARRGDLFIPRSVSINAPVRRDLRDSAALDALLPRLLQQVPDATAIYYISPRAVMRYYSDPVVGIAQLLLPDYPITYTTSYLQALPLSDPGRKTVWQLPYLSQQAYLPAQQGLLVTASTPVYAGKEFRGVIAVDVSLTGLIQHLGTLKPTKSAYAFLVDPIGRLIAAPPWALRDLVGPAAPPAISPTTILGLSLTPALRQTLSATRRGQQGITRVQLGGRWVFLSYAPLSDLGWSLGVVAPIQEITQPAAKVREAIGREANRTIQWTLEALGASLMLVLLAALWLSRRELLQPINRLMAATRAMSAGDLQVSIPVTRRDELGQLAHSFNTMSADLVRLVRQQQAEARERERIAQELRVARLVQTTLLPKELPTLPGWQLAAHYQPARQIGGDFYDFFTLPDGCLGLAIGDVAEKGVPAALVMATTRTILRGAAQRLVSPGQVLERANELLYPDIPPNMFVTCFYAILDPASGRLQYANAGHDLPYVHHTDGMTELHARGMPLGLLPGMHYEEQHLTIARGENVLLYSDGLVEAHNPQREMFGFPRLRALVAAHPLDDGRMLIHELLAELERFTGAGWEQEDDITLVTLQRRAVPALRTGPLLLAGTPTGAGSTEEASGDGPWRTVATWTLPSAPGTERRALEQVVAAVQDLALPAARLERLTTAVGEAVANAIEHGNQNRSELPVSLTVLVSATALCVRVTDQGGGRPIPAPDVPDLDAKLAGEQTPRGWGLFLIKDVVDDVRDRSTGTEHTTDLILHRQGDEHGDATP